MYIVFVNNEYIINIYIKKMFTIKYTARINNEEKLN